MRERRMHLAGWVMFILCAVLFLISGVRNRDIYSISGNVVFLAACFAFVLPLVRRDTSE